MQQDSFVDAASGDVMSKFKMTHSITTEQEERRMSDLSDWASSITSAADMQVRVSTIYMAIT